MSPSLDIRQRLLLVEQELLDVLSSDDLDAATSFANRWTQLHADVETAMVAKSLDDETAALAHTIASEVVISAELFSSQFDNMHAALVTMDSVLDGLSLNDDPESSDAQYIMPPPPPTRPDPSLPPYIEPAYKWLLKHLHNPYPKKEIKEKIADETGSSMERISDWFVDVRRRMGWTRLLREEFGRKRVDLIDAATRYYVHPNRKYPLPADIHGKFVEMEAFAKEMYAAKFVPSALSNKLTAAVKDLTPELQEQAREQRWQKVQVEREAAKLGYPSPPPSGASSPISDPGASTSFAGRKRSSSEISDVDDSLSKRSRTNDSDPFALPSPPYSGQSTPNSRKRRLSDADAPNAKRPRNRAASDPIPVTITLTETPEFLADWFSSDRGGDTNLFEPGQLLDIKFFDPAEYDFPEEEPPAPLQPAVKTTTLPPMPESDMITFNIPGGSGNDLDSLFDFATFSDGFYHHPPPDLNDSYVSYTPMDPYPRSVVYEPSSFMEPFTGAYDSGYITRDSVAESFGFESADSQENPMVYSALPGKASGHLISGLFEQQHKIQNEYPLYPPISY
ncbi:C-terminal domain of homeodomain 1-domain-containing protein [Mycena capillaripes]|nr:C-terminal domain of homeodomain 1-domain-containing protein [Mycena capillaripes]